MIILKRKIKTYMGSNNVAEDNLRTLCLSRGVVQMWKPEWFRHGRGRGRQADRTEGEVGMVSSWQGRRQHKHLARKRRKR